MRGCGGACIVAGGVRGCWGACIGYDEIQSMRGQYASYRNAFMFESKAIAVRNLVAER